MSVRAPSAPQDNQCEMTFLNLSGAYRRPCYGHFGLWDFYREYTATNPSLFFSLDFNVEVDVDNRERARARDKKHRRQMSLEFNSGGEKMRNVRGQ